MARRESFYHGEHELLARPGRPGRYFVHHTASGRYRGRVENFVPGWFAFLPGGLQLGPFKSMRVAADVLLAFPKLPSSVKVPSRDDHGARVAWRNKWETWVSGVVFALETCEETGTLCARIYQRNPYGGGEETGIVAAVPLCELVSIGEGNVEDEEAHYRAHLKTYGEAQRSRWDSPEPLLA